MKNIFSKIYRAISLVDLSKGREKAEARAIRITGVSNFVIVLVPTLMLPIMVPLLYNLWSFEIQLVSYVSIFLAYLGAFISRALLLKNRIRLASIAAWINIFIHVTTLCLIDADDPAYITYLLLAILPFLMFSIHDKKLQWFFCLLASFSFLGYQYYYRVLGGHAVFGPPKWIVSAELSMPPYALLVAALIMVVYQFVKAVEEAEKEAFIEHEKASKQSKLVQLERDRLREALNILKSTQDQLIQQEKLASLGQLTAGIAHEIKNPLNFVTNFSELSEELIDELREELQNKDIEEADAIAIDIKSNLSKINDHGKRADSIVKAMLQHSRGSDGKMEPTDFNALVKEYVNLSFHGMRAGKNPIDVNLEFDLDDAIGDVPLIAEDFSRVILNLTSNAFDACAAKIKARESESSDSYNAKVSVRTKQENGSIILEIEDNGSGIPDDIKDKILQPFFTTKKGTEGTGLGLSITNDIIKAHGGILSVESEMGKGAIFALSFTRLERKF